MRFRTGLLAAACLAAPTAGAAAQTVTTALNADIRSTNPGVNRDANTDRVVLHMVEGLVGYTETGAVAPLLAEKVEVSPDGRVYTFRLRKGVKFHNGAEMTAADVLWSWRRYADPKTDWRCLSEFDGRAGGVKVTGVEAPDPATVVMTIDKPSATFLDTMARTDCAMVAILHKDSVKADGSWDKPIGTGPFKLGEWKRGESITLTRFDGYVSPPGDKPNGFVGAKRPLIEAVKFLFIADGATTRAALMSGALDVAAIVESDVAELSKVKHLEVKTTPVAVKHAILFQTRDKVLGNVKLRQAMAMALDLPELVAAVSNGLGKPNASAIYPASAFHDETQRRSYRHDAAAVKKLLTEAGYKGEPIKLIANKRSTVPSFPAAVIAQAMWQAAGLNVEIEVLEWATQLDRYQKGNYQAMSFSYSARFDPALSYEQFMGPKDTQSRKVWDDPKAQALLDKASIVADEEQRRALFDELHKLQLEQTPLIFLFNEIEASAANRRVQGYTPWVGNQPRFWEVKVVP